MFICSSNTFVLLKLGTLLFSNASETMKELNMFEAGKMSGLEALCSNFASTVKKNRFNFKFTLKIYFHSFFCQNLNKLQIGRYLTFPIALWLNQAGF